MTEAKPGVLSRIALALRILFSADLAAQLLRAEYRELQTPVAEKSAEPAPVLQKALPDAALQLLGLLQRDGRFIDFIEEEVSGFSDADIGAAARVVHEGCRKTLREHFTVEPVRSEQEGSRVSLELDFDVSAVRLIGNVVGEPPFTGNLTHRGWRVSEAKLPKLAAGHDTTVLAPAEVEL